MFNKYILKNKAYTKTFRDKDASNVYISNCNDYQIGVISSTQHSVILLSPDPNYFTEKLPFHHI